MKQKINKGATISKCGKYRWHLWRNLHDKEYFRRKTCLFIMLNPSTANADEDDPTIRRCMGFANHWGYDRLEVVNLFSWRETDSKKLIEPSFDCWGEKHWEYFDESIRNAGLIICAWGSHPWAKDVARYAIMRIKKAGKKPMCLKINNNGAPGHPLYLKKDLPPIVYEGK